MRNLPGVFKEEAEYFAQGGDLKAKSGRTPRAILRARGVSRQNRADIFGDFSNCDSVVSFAISEKMFLYFPGGESHGHIFAGEVRQTGMG